jgi:hypothetical protein
MRLILAAMLIAFGIGMLTPQTASAAPANGAAISNALEATSMVDNVACRRVCNWRGCWTRCWRSAPVYIAPAPVYRIAPACRSVRVCDWRGCWWTRRCW